TCLATAMASRSCRLDGPRQAWGHPRPRGSAFGVLLGEVLAKGRGQRIISARTPVPYPRMKTGSRVPDADSWRANFSLPPRSVERRLVRCGAFFEPSTIFVVPESRIEPTTDFTDPSDKCGVGQLVIRGPDSLRDPRRAFVLWDVARRSGWLIPPKSLH